MKNEISDEKLIQAVRKVSGSMIASLPALDSCNREFSTEFSDNMAPLLKKARQRHHVFRYMQRVAVIFIAVLLSLGLWLSIDTEARATFIQWVRNVYEDSFVYEFFGVQEGASIPNCTLAWVPDGYIETDRTAGYSMCIVTYTFGDESFVLHYSFMSEGTKHQIFSEGLEPIEVQINGQSGYFYESRDPTSTNDLIWMDESKGIEFTLSAFLEQETLIHIAESVLFK